MILAWKGQVVNLYGRAVRVVNSVGNIILTYKCDGTARANWTERYFGMLNGDVELAYREAIGISGLPEPTMQTYYIVRKDVALAAWQMGRGVDDLLVPMRPSGYSDLGSDEPPSCRALMPAMFLFDPRQARRRYEPGYKHGQVN